MKKSQIQHGKKFSRNMDEASRGTLGQIPSSSNNDIEENKAS